MVVLVSAYIKRFDVCVAAIVGIIARVVYTSMQEAALAEARYSCCSSAECGILCTRYLANW